MKTYGSFLTACLIGLLGCQNLSVPMEGEKTYSNKTHTLAKINGFPYITYVTYPNSAHEWATDMTAHHYDEGTFTYNIRWFRRAQFTNYQWQETTNWATGPINQYLITEQHYGLCFEVYCVQQFINEAGMVEHEEASDVYLICYEDDF